MTPHQVFLVQRSFAALAPRADEVAGLFYERLFAADPSLRPLFRGDMADQRRKLMSALALAVQALARPQAIVPALEAMGRRHAGYGVEDADYDTVGSTLLATLRAGLGAAFDPELEAAWTACYTLVATTMRNGAAADSVTAVAA